MKMKLLNSWRFAIKCMKLSYNIKANLIIMGFMFVMALGYEIFYIAEGMGALLLMLLAMYPAQLVCSVCGSQLVLSSPYKKTLMTSLPTILTLCSSMILYLAVICIEAVRVHMTPETADRSSRIVLYCGIMLILLDICVGLAYKYFVMSLIIMSVSMIGFYYLSGMIGMGTAILQYIPEIPMPIAAVLGLCLALTGNALQYGVYLLVYKKPMSRRAMFGLLRQQA